MVTRLKGYLQDGRGCCGRGDLLVKRTTFSDFLEMLVKGRRTAVDLERDVYVDFKHDE
jgi:hypothetical protein